MAHARFDTTVRVALDTLRANPLRTMLSTLGILMGAAALAAVLALGDGMERFARESLVQEGLQTVTLVPRTGDVIDGVLVPRTSYPAFVLADAQDLDGRLQPPHGLALAVDGSSIATLAGARRGVLTTAATPIGMPLPWLKAARGRLPDEQDARRGDRVVAVSQALASAMAPPSGDAALGATLRLGEADWRVVGVLESSPRMGRSFRAVVPFPLAAQALAPAATGRVTVLHVNAGRVEDMAALRKDAEAWLAAHGWTKQIDVQDKGAERLRQVKNGIIVFKIMMGAITAISLLVGGIGIMNVLLASVVERTREIGIRKAIGASRGTVVAQFLSESVAISLAGAAIGVAAGLSAAALVTAIMRVQTEARVYSAVTWQTIVISMAAAAAVGLVFGTYPALRAARLSPMDAIQRE